jgi:16S rRNA (guanine966-N2)-methyltransferase
VAPKGHSTRPTADRTRQALFNVLEHAAWGPRLEGARLLDLFAGSGALGLEGLSRGAGFCLFIDSDPAAVSTIGDNLRALGLAARGAARRWDATRPHGGPPDGPFDLVFLDPPYASGLVEPALAAITGGGWLAPAALTVVERGALEPRPQGQGFTILDSRRWGAARVWFLRSESGDRP